MKSGCAFSAWLAGIVHGVVVQITAKASPSGSAGKPNAAASFARSCASIGNATSIALSTRSSYSTSASASALWQSKHQLTGFSPRYT